MEHLLIFGAVCITTWFLFIYFWPRMVLYVYKRAILVKGFGNGPIPINTLYTQPQALFADPVHVSLPPGSSKLMSYGTNRDTLYVCGWLDLRTGPLILHVPDMAGRYYSVQFTDPSKNVNFAYVSKRTTGTEAGDFLISGPGWKGPVQRRMAQISSPNNSVAVIGRVFVANDGDLPIAYALVRQLHFVPLAGQQSSTARDSDMRRLRWAIKMLPSGPAPADIESSRNCGFRDAAKLRHHAMHSRHHTKDKQRFVLSVIAYDFFPGHQAIFLKR